MILSVLLLLSGFLLYCAIASIGGSAAGKQEDLSSTNVLFTMILVVSFLVSLAVGGVGIGSSGAASAWVYWVPFTSVLDAAGQAAAGRGFPDRRGRGAGGIRGGRRFVPCAGGKDLPDDGPV